MVVEVAAGTVVEAAVVVAIVVVAVVADAVTPAAAATGASATTKQLADNHFILTRRAPARRVFLFADAKRPCGFVTP